MLNDRVAGILILGVGQQTGRIIDDVAADVLAVVRG